MLPDGRSFPADEMANPGGHHHCGSRLPADLGRRPGRRRRSARRISTQRRGGSGGLFAADGVTPIDSVTFGKQQTDVSYGRVPDGGSELRAIASPTPGAANVVLYEGIVEPPQISVKTGFCSEPTTVTLTTATPGATIYYSVDGSDPLSQGPTRSRSAGSMGSVYTTTLRVSKTTTLKAVAIKPGWRQSTVRHGAVYLPRRGYAELQLAAADCGDRFAGPDRLDGRRPPRSAASSIRAREAGPRLPVPSISPARRPSTFAARAPAALRRSSTISRRRTSRATTRTSRSWALRPSRTGSSRGCTPTSR